MSPPVHVLNEKNTCVAASLHVCYINAFTITQVSKLIFILNFFINLNKMLSYRRETALQGAL